IRDLIVTGVQTCALPISSSLRSSQRPRLVVITSEAKQSRCFIQEREAAMAETRIGVIGCAGRMGRMLVADIATTEGCVLAGGVARPGAACVGQDLGELAGVARVGIAVGDNAERLLRDSDVAVDFTMATAT